MNIVYNKYMKNTKKSRRGWIMIAIEHCNLHVAQQNPVKQNFQPFTDLAMKVKIYYNL